MVRYGVVALVLGFAFTVAAPLNAVAQITPTVTETKKTESRKASGRAAARARQKQCGTEWRAAKSAGQVEKGMTWPKYWSACNKRLKAGAA